MGLLIGLVGRKRSGKDTLAGFATEAVDGLRVMSIAEPLKQACKLAYVLSDEQLEESKDVVDPRWGSTPRDMFKALGTKFFRSEDPDQWTKNMAFRIRGAGVENVVVPDVRFQNEATFIRENGGFLVHVFRDLDTNDDDHPTERTTDEIECDFYIENDGSLEDLRSKLSPVLREIVDTGTGSGLVGAGGGATLASVTKTFRALKDFVLGVA